MINKMLDSIANMSSLIWDCNVLLGLGLSFTFRNHSEIVPINFLEYLIHKWLVRIMNSEDPGLYCSSQSFNI